MISTFSSSLSPNISYNNLKLEFEKQKDLFSKINLKLKNSSIDMDQSYSKNTHPF